jgi:hypothetical protein
MGDEGIMEAKNFGGVLIAGVVVMLGIAAAAGSPLAWVDVALVGLLYFVRRRRLGTETVRAGTRRFA